MGYYKMLFIQNFCVYYFEYWSCMIIGIVQIAVFYISRSVFHDEFSTSGNISHFFSETFTWLFYATIIHCILTKVGLV